MAIILIGRSRCPLCDEILDSGQETVATTAFIEDVNHPLWRYSDAAMHAKCFLGWSQREAFIDGFNEFWRRRHRGMRFMDPDGKIHERESQLPNE